MTRIMCCFITRCCATLLRILHSDWTRMLLTTTTTTATILYSTLLYSTPLYSTLLYSTLFYSTLLPLYFLTIR